MNQEKLVKSANQMYTIVNILEKVVIIGMICIVFGAGLLWLVPKGTNVSMSTTMNIGNLGIELYENALPEKPFQIWYFIIILIAAAMVCGLVFYGLRMIKDILVPMKEGRPFNDNVPATIRKLGLLVLIGGVVGQGAMYVSNVMMITQYLDFMELFNREVVKSVTIHNSFSLSFVFVSLLLYLLSYVFEYGQKLQQESDETL